MILKEYRKCTKNGGQNLFHVTVIGNSSITFGTIVQDINQREIIETMDGCFGISNHFFDYPFVTNTHKFKPQSLLCYFKLIKGFIHKANLHKPSERQNRIHNRP